MGATPMLADLDLQYFQKREWKLEKVMLTESDSAIKKVIRPNLCCR